MRQLEKILVTVRVIASVIGSALDRYVEARAVSLCPSFRSADPRYPHPRRKRNRKGPQSAVPASANWSGEFVKMK